jgi:chromosome segregation ATPase
MDTVLERLQALEMKVREILAELERARRVRETLEADLGSRNQEMAVLQADRQRDGAELARLRAERDEVRKRVEGLLEEIARLEATMQAIGA